MPSYSAGSVSAKIELDTSEFKKAVSQLKEEVTGLKTAFNILKGGNPLEKEVEKLKKEIDSLKQTNEDYKKSLNRLREDTDKLTNSSKKASETIKNEQKNLDNLVKKTNEATAANEKYLKSQSKVTFKKETSNRYGKRLSDNEFKQYVADIQDYFKTYKGLPSDFDKDYFHEGLASESGLRKHLDSIRDGFYKTRVGVLDFQDALRTLNIKDTFGEDLINYSEMTKSVDNWKRSTVERVKDAEKMISKATASMKNNLHEVTLSFEKDATAITNALNKIAQIEGNEKYALKNSAEQVANSVKQEAEALKTEEKSIDSNVKKTEEYVGAQKKQIQVMREVEAETKKLTKEQELLAKKALTEEAFNYISGLKRGRRQGGRNSSLLGTDTAVFDIGEDGKKRRIFDFDRFKNHMYNTFKDIIPHDIYKKLMSEIDSKYKLGVTDLDYGGDPTGIGGLTTDKLIDLKAAAMTYKGSIDELKSSFADLSPDVEKVKTVLDVTFDGFKKDIVDVINSIRQFAQIEGNEAATAENTANALTKEQQSLKDLAKALKEYNQENNRFTEASNKSIEQLELEARSNELTAKSTDQYAASLRKLAQTLKEYNAAHGFGRDAVKAAEALITENDAAIKLEHSLYLLAKGIKYVNTEGDRFTAASQNIIRDLSLMAQENEKGTNSFSQQQKVLQYIVTGYNKLSGAIIKTSEVLQTFNFKLLEGVDRETIFYQRTVALASAMQRFNAQGSNAKDRFGNQIYGGSQQVGGYSNYIQQLSEIQKWTLETEIATGKLGTAYLSNANNLNTYKMNMESVNQTLEKQVAEIEKLNAAQQKQRNQLAIQYTYGNQYENLSRDIQILQHHMDTLTNSTQKNKNAFSQESRQAAQLAKDLELLFRLFSEGSITQDKFTMELEKLEQEYSQLSSRILSTTEQIERNNAELSKTSANARQAGRGITTFNNGVVQTAHSGRILSNTLYQIRGALLSLKMIATAMGGMALWGFAMEIAEGVKTTFTAKNELEAQLKQNAKVGASGLREFNKELDVTAQRFQKINKYQLGETVSSLGVEFNLGIRQMKKAMPIVAMVQSEYIRAGRTSEEAALAVKDILQGEFQRLSRETGVGKDDLIKYGWSGDKTDIDSLLDAVKKAGEDRHWDVFAEKATSLNDVIEITKNRFQEFGADFLQTISPMIVSAFNTVIGTIDKLHKAFDGMGSFGKNALVGGGFIGGITVIGTLLPMITKGMGLAEISTLGWGKSLLTAALNLNKLEVGNYGLRKAITAVITGTKASEVANIRTTKALMGRALGLDQVTLREKGYLGAMVKSHASLKEGITLLKTHEVYTATRLQKLAYLTGKIDLADVKTLKWNQSIKAIITSTRLWGAALKGLIGIGIIAWFASVASWADAVRARVDLFNDYTDNGKQKVKEAKKLVDDYNTALSKMGTDDPNYAQTKANAQTAEHNLKSTEAANQLAKQIKKDSEETAKNYDMMYTRGLNSIYEENGYKAVEEYGEDYLQMKYAAYDIAHAEEEREKFQYASLQHINEHTKQMELAKVDEKQRLKYITEYSVKAKQAAENLRKFNEGDLTAGAYYVLNRLQLMWIDLWNDSHFVNFWESVKKTWKDLQPTLNQLIKSLGDLGHILLDFFATSQGQFVGGAIVVGAAIAGIAYKVAPTLKKLKDFGSTLKDVLGKVKDWKRETGSSPTEELPKTDETEGLPTETGKVWKKGEFWKTVGNDAKNIARDYLKAATHIALAMGLITEAILLINAPMGALAATGIVFKALEPQIRAGIEGLKLIAPVVLALLVPTVALMTIMSYFHVQTSTLLEGFKSAATGVALGIILVTEAIVLLNAPLLGLAILGSVYSGVQDAAQQGIKAMQVIGDALKELVIWVPVFAAGIALAAITIGSGGVGGIAIVAAAAGIALGIGLVTEAIIGLCIPLEAVAEIGANFPDLSNAQQGAEAMKVTAEALKYVEQGVASLVMVQWEVLASNIAKLLGVDMGTALDDLVKDDGFLPKLSNFAEKFNNMEFTPIQEDKAQALKTTAEGLTAVNDALKSATDAINNLPPEFKNGGNGQPLLSYDMENATTGVTAASTGEEPSNYFDQLKKPLEELGKFITWFNTELQFPSEGVDTDKIATISQSADMVTQINDAVNKVKQAMGNIAMGNVATNFAQMTSGSEMPAFGGIGAIGSLIGFATSGGQGDYQSSIGGQLYEMELVLKDLSTFNNNVSGLGGASGGGGGGAMQEGTSGVAQGLTDMVTAVSQAISTLESTLAQAVPNIKQNANNIGTGIRDGIKTGIGDLTTLTVPPLVTALNAAKATGHTYGTGVGYQTTQGYKSGLKVKSATEDEINTTLTYLDGKKQDFYDKGAALGDALSRGYKEKGMEHFSPGRLARATFDELGYIEQAFDEAIMVIPSKAEELGASLAENYTPQLATDIGLTDMTTYEAGLAQIGLAVENTDMQTSMAFNNMNMTTATTMGNMTTTVNGAFTNIDQNATTSYGRIVNTTRTSLKNMQDQTTKNIGAIRTSWHGMQTALIASAEQIRSETSSKIHQLESNMASFWNKIQNPANLLAGNPMIGGHTRTQSRPTGISSHKGGRKILAAGNPALGQRVTGISDRFKSIGSDSKVRERFAEYLQCLLSGGVCAAGGGSGWHFNWSKEIQDVFMQWHTHFGEIYDPYLRVGKFENDDFPVRGIAPIALKYIEDAIGRTSYDFYYDERYSPLEAWNRGAFNCVDGARLAIAFANAFGFGGGEIRYTTWDGIGHAYAYIPELGVIDATAIQGDYGLTASKVSYSAGSHTVPQSRPPQTTQNSGTTVNIGDIHVNINGDVENAEEKGKQIGEEINNKIYGMLRRSLGTGQ